MAVAVSLALLAASLFGTALVATQFALRHAPPDQGALISVGTSALLLAAAALLQGDRALWHGEAALLFALIGLVFPAAVTRLTFAANRRLGPSLTAALGNLSPLFAVAGAVLLLGDRPVPSQAAGLAAVIAGVVALSLTAGFQRAGWRAPALALPLAAAAIRGLVQPAAKAGLLLWPNPLAAAAIGYAVSALVLAVITPRRGLPSPPALAGFAVVGVCNGAAVLTLYAALAAGPVVLVAPLVATYPVMTVLLAALLLRRTGLGGLGLAGVAATVGGVMLLLAG